MNKKEFNDKYTSYLSNQKNTSDIITDLNAIISNAIKGYNFEGQPYPHTFLKEDVQAELLVHYLNREEYIRSNYNGQSNYYNVLFTLFRNKFNDLCRSKKRQDNLKETMNQLRDSVKDITIYSNEGYDEEEG